MSKLLLRMRSQALFGDAGLAIACTGLLWVLGFSSWVAARETEPQYVPFARIAADQKAVLQYRTGMQAVLDYMDSQPKLFPADKLMTPRLPASEVLGRTVTTANDIAKLFDEEYGSPHAQFELLLFLDGLEKKSKAQLSSEEEFRRSWRRPKWHILLQDL